MRKILFLIAAFGLMATSASAADVVPRTPTLTIPPIVNWSGFYVGAHAGYGSGNASVTDLNGGVKPGPFDYNPGGALGGIQGGYNYQFNNGIVAGIEADLGYLSANGSGIIGSANAAAHQDLTLNGGFVGDVTGRIGYAFNKFLIYGKGGYAYFDGSAGQKTTNPGYVTTGTGAWNGYVFGGGVEYMILPRVSIKAEYLRYEFGSRGGAQTNTGDLSSPIGYQFRNSTSLNYDTYRIGANYHF